MWSDRDLQQASFRGVEFDFVDIEDGLKKSIARYDYPYADGSDLEDMGLEARTIRLRAIFFGETYANLEDFIDAVREQGFGYLNHPVFGTIKAIPETVSIRHDERSYHAEVDLNFIEHLEMAVTRVSKTAYSALSDSGEQAVDALGEAGDRLDDTRRDAGIPVDIPIDTLGQSGYMASISNYTSSIRSAMSKISTAVGTMQSYVNQATEPFKLITSAVDYTTALPGTVLGKIAEGIESVAGAYQSLLNAPGKFMDSLNYGLSKIDRALKEFETNGDTVSNSISASWKVSRATALMTAAAVEFAADEAAEKATALGLRQFGSDSSIARTQIMTIDELDALVATAKAAINEAINAVRVAYPDTGYDLIAALKAQALAIQQTADEIRLRREKIINYDLPSDMPLHLLAFNLYGDINEAERLLRINSIRNPNFLRAGETLRVYA